MPKRSRADSPSEAIESVFGKLFAITNTPDVSDVEFSDDFNRILKKLKHHVLSAAAEEEKSIRKAASDFTLEEAVREFRLIYSRDLGQCERYSWGIEMLPDFETLQPSACFASLLANYSTIYDLSSEAAYRLGVDLLLCESIATMRRKDSVTQPTEDGRRTSTYWNSVKVYCEVSFTHQVDSFTKKGKKKKKRSKNTVIGGRVDHCVGIAFTSNKSHNRLFHLLLLNVEAKFEGTILKALDQLTVYLACLRQSRINKGRSDASVYGVATDGLSYVFLTITNDGVLKKSRKFGLLDGELPIVLGCFKYVLEKALSMTPFLTPEKLTTSEDEEDTHDDPIDLDDSHYLQSDDEEMSTF